jgi:hypothetical protein
LESRLCLAQVIHHLVSPQVENYGIFDAGMRSRLTLPICERQVLDKIRLVCQNTTQSTQKKMSFGMNKKIAIPKLITKQMQLHHGHEGRNLFYELISW